MKYSSPALMCLTKIGPVSGTVILLSCIYFQHGITQANELVNLTEFFVNHILPDLKSNNGEFCEFVSFL